MDNPKPIGKGLGEYLDGQRKQIEGLQIQLKAVKEQVRVVQRERNIYLRALEILAHFPCKSPCKNKEPGKCEMWRCTGCTAREAIKAGERW